MTTVTIGNTVYAAPGGGGGAWNGIGGAGTFAPTNTSTGGPAQYATSITQAWSCGNGYSSGFGGGGGGALGQRNASSQNGAIANIDAGTSYSRFLGTILNTVINSSGGAPEYESPYLNNSSNYGRYMAQQVNGAALDGGSPARWGGGGGGGSYSGGNGGNGNLGGGGGGAAGGSRQTALWWRNTDPGNRTLTDALSRNGALYISVKIRQGSPWGNSFESSEGIDVQYSLNNGSTWTSMAYISSDIGTFDWHVAKYKVPLEARGSGVRFRVNQRPWTSTIDQWACGDGQIHYADGSVDVLWTPASIPGLYWYASGTQDTDYSLSETPPGYTGYVAPIASRGGNGGSGFVLFGFVSGNGVQYVLRTSGSGTVTVPANTDKILCWAVGGGGGGGGAPADSVSEGGGGASGSINYFEIDNVAGDLGVNTTGSSGSTSYGLAGKAVFFKDNRKPTFTLNNNGIISGSYT